MLQRISDLVNNGTVKLCIFTSHVKFHLLIELSWKITDHTREFIYNALDWNHSNFHNWLMQICSDALQILDLLMVGLVLEITGLSGSDCHKTVLCNDKLRYLVHQGIQLFNINTDSTVCHRFCNSLFLIVLCCRCFCRCRFCLLSRCCFCLCRSLCLCGFLCCSFFCLCLFFFKHLTFYFFTDYFFNFRYRLGCL